MFKSIAEAILIQVGRSLLTELEQEDHFVRINSLGDTGVKHALQSLNSLTSSVSALIFFLPQARELMKDHPIPALMYL